jgi:hypothetical protein
LFILAGRWVFFAEQVRMEVPEDLGQRIVEATRLAVALHLQQSLLSELDLNPGGTGVNFGGAMISIGRADLYGPDATDGDFPADPGIISGAQGTASGADCEAA